jgi:hypothetical protein
VNLALSEKYGFEDVADMIVDRVAFGELTDGRK